MIEWKKTGLRVLMTIPEPPLELFYTEAGRTIVGDNDNDGDSDGDVYFWL